MNVRPDVFNGIELGVSLILYVVVLCTLSRKRVYTVVPCLVREILCFEIGRLPYNRSPCHSCGSCSRLVCVELNPGPSPLSNRNRKQVVTLLDDVGLRANHTAQALNTTKQTVRNTM